jgi:hypothetical protein
VPGSLSTSLDWWRVASLLSGRFACHVMDRRGRGMSGDALQRRSCRGQAHGANHLAPDMVADEIAAFLSR